MQQQERLVTVLEGKDNTRPAFESMQSSMRNTMRQSGKLNQQFRFMRGGAGQFGHQIQDIAVQLSMGTNAMIVFGQQGSQIASLFGPQGALLGAVLAVGAGIATAFVRDTKKGDDALKDLEQTILDTIESTGMLNDTFRATLINIYEARVEALNEQLQTQKDAQQEANNQLAEHTKLTDRAASAENSRLGQLGKIEDSTRAARIDTDEYTTSTQNAAGSILDLTNKIDALQKKINVLEQGEIPEEINEGAKNTTRSFESFIESLDKATISTAQGKVAAKAYELSLLDLEGAQLDAALAALGRYEQSLLDAEADKQAAKAIADRTAAQRANFEQAQKGIIQADLKRKTDEAAARAARERQIESLKTFSELKGELGDTYLQMKKLEDGLVDVTEKGMAQFTDSFYDAISGAKSFKDAFKDMARSIVEDLSKMLIQYYITQQIFGLITNALPAPSATPVASGGSGSTAMSFAGGGFTGYGARSGGMDGRGGFPAILHPNETVIDHTRDQGGGVVVNQTINVTTGVQQTVRAEIANLLPQISNAAKAAVADGRMRGGGFGKAMGG